MEGSAVDPDGAAEPVEGFLWFGVPSQERGSDSWTRGALLVLAAQSSSQEIISHESGPH